MYQKNSGITLVEVAVAIALFLLITLSLAPSLLHLASAQYKQLLYAKRYHDVSQAVITLQHDLARANKFLRAPTPFLHDTETPASSNGWHFVGSGDTNRTLILSLVATTEPEQSISRRPSYIASTHENCRVDIKEPLTYNAVYYLYNNNLYRRTLIKTPANMRHCDTVSQKASNLTGNGGQKKDVVVLQDIRNLRIAYHEDGKAPPATAAYDHASTDDSAKQTPLPYKGISIQIDLQDSPDIGIRNETIHIKEALL